ncbi:MAG: low molecular weight protein-tyrosine-phosphatase [Clostridia bacterium]|nr:low molecular weight protein-tyrosine-phosphatase [Clostridia bacterium]
MVKILFVCLGNICRSPMAEFLMKDLVKSRGIQNDFYIESAATSTEELGNGVYPPVKKLLAARGIDCTGKRARQMTAADYNKFDYIVCMDSSNLRNMNYIAADTQGKYRKLLDFTDNPHDVADPWYTRNFALTESDIERGCEALLEHISLKEI